MPPDVPDRAWSVAVRGSALGLLTATGAAVLALLLGRFTLQATAELIAAADASTNAGAALETVLAAAVTAIGALVAGWYAVSASIGTCCSLARAVGRTWRAGELLLRRSGAPGVARLVGAGTGALLTAGLVLAPAQADPPEPAADPAVAEDLTWAAAAEDATASASAEASPSEATTAEPSPTPDSPTEVSPAEASSTEPSSTSAPSSTDAQSSAPTDGGYIVQSGDTLWGIAAAYLDAEVSAARIAMAWPDWYEANRAAIGADPDLILPGTVLHEPG